MIRSTPASSIASASAPCRPGRGHEPVDRAEIGEEGERHLVELRVVGEQDDLGGRGDHRLLDRDLLERGVAQPVDGNAGRGDECLVGPESGERADGDVADRAACAAAEHAAGEDDRRVGVLGHLGGGRDRVRHDPQVAPVDELAGELSGRRSRVDDDRRAVGDELGRAPGDRALGLLLLAGAKGVLRLDAAHRDRAAVLAPHHARLGEPGQVAPDGDLCDAQAVGQIRHPDRAGLARQVGDRAEAIRAQHAPPAVALALHSVHTKSIMIESSGAVKMIVRTSSLCRSIGG